MSKKPIIQQFTDDVNKVIDKYRDTGITIGEIIGAFEIAQLDLLAEFHAANEDRSDDLPRGFPDIYLDGEAN
jgi:hypothetical protein